MNKYAHAKPGFSFVLTELGFEIGYVRVKFDQTQPAYRKYRHTVPSAWVEKRYVVELSDDSEV